MDQKETNLKSYRSRKNQDNVELDIGRQLEKNVLQDGVQVHGAKNSPSCSMTQRMEVDNVSSSNAITEIVIDGQKGDIIAEGEVIVSLSSVSGESKCTVDQTDGAIGPVNSSVACDRFSHGSRISVLADEISTSDPGGDGNGTIELVHSCDRGSNVSGSLGPADGKNACDRGGHDKSGIGSSDSRNISNLFGHDKSGTGPTDGKKTCDRVDHDKIGFGPSNGKMACYLDDHDKGSTGFDCAFHTIGSIGLADSKVVCAHVGQANSTIGYTDDEDVYDLADPASSRDGSADDSNSCDRSGSSSIGAPDDKGAFGHRGDGSGGIEFVYEDNCDSGGEVSSNFRHADSKDVCYLIGDGSNSTTSEAGDDNDGVCGNNSGGIWNTDSRDVFDGIDNESGLVDGTHPSRHLMAAYPADVTREEESYLSDISFCDDDYSEVASDSFVDEYASGDGHSFEEKVDTNGGDGYDDYFNYWEGYGKVTNCWNEGEQKEQEEQEYDDDDDEDKEEDNEEEEEEEDYWGEGYEDESYLDYPGVLMDSTKKSEIESINLCHYPAKNHQSPWPVPLAGPFLSLKDEGNGQGDFKTSKEAFNEDRKRNSGSLPKCQLSRTKTENDLETQSCSKATLDEHVLIVSGLSKTTTKDGLLNFIEVLSGGEVKDITMMKQGNALVTISTQVQGL